jgi:cbb3-type cytochrome oxidase maturation protein
LADLQEITGEGIQGSFNGQIARLGCGSRLDELTDERHCVLIVGDGVNDSAVLASAHASIAPPTALKASRNAADVVALRESFAELPLVIVVARANASLHKQNLEIAALYSCIAVPIALAGFATPLAAHAMSIIFDDYIFRLPTDEVRETNVLVFLKTVSLILGEIGLVVFWWTVRSDQYDGDKGNAACILLDDD